MDEAIEVFSTAESSVISLDEKTYTNMICFYGKAGKFYTTLWIFLNDFNISSYSEL